MFCRNPKAGIFDDSTEDASPVEAHDGKSQEGLPPMAMTSSPTKQASSVERGRPVLLHCALLKYFASFPAPQSDRHQATLQLPDMSMVATSHQAMSLLSQQDRLTRLAEAMQVRC